MRPNETLSTGISHSLMDRIFDYHYTTADEKAAAPDSHPTSGDYIHPSSSSSPHDDPVSSSGIGLLCEAAGTYGHALMHGYGFGLPTSKAYAEYLGGSLVFQSMQGVGCDFYLRLGLLDLDPETVLI